MAEENNRWDNLFKWSAGGLLLYSFLTPESKKGISNFASQLLDAWVASESRKSLVKQTQSVPDLKPKTALQAGPIDTRPVIFALPSSKQNLYKFPDADKTPTTLTITKPIPPSKPILEPDAAWRNNLVHPSIVLILGKRGSGKSALAYRILELFRWGPKPYVVGLPANARSILPDWIGMVTCLEDLPVKAIAVIDEAYLHYHSRGSLAQESKVMSQIINLSRQKEQTIIFVTQEARQVDRNIASSANIIIFKDLGILQMEFDRHELNQLTAKAREVFSTIQGDKHRWSYVYAPDTDFKGLMENELPSFWKRGLSKVFASGIDTPISRIPRKLTFKDKIQKARELREQGISYGEIARMLGVSKSSVINYIKGYPYKS